MVTVTNYVERTRKDGSIFIALEITGGVELVQSTNSGKFYATVRKTNIPSTFSKEIAKGIIGSQMKGDVIRVTTDPYNFVDKRTGETIQLQHSYAYSPEGSTELIGSSRVESLQMA